MRKFLLIMAMLALALTGCRAAVSTAAGDGASKLTSDSAPGVLLNSPGRARDAAAQANERATQVQQALPQAPNAH